MSMRSLCRALAAGGLLLASGSLAGAEETPVLGQAGAATANSNTYGCAAYSPDGRHFVFGGSVLQVYDAKTRKVVAIFGRQVNRVTAVDFSDDGKQLAVEYPVWDPPAEGTNIAHEIVVYSFPGGQEKARFKGLESDYNRHRRLAISPDGTLVATSNAKGIAVFEITTGKVTWEYKHDPKANPNSSYSAFDVTPDWKYFLLNLARIDYPAGTVSCKARFNKEERPFYWADRISADGKRAVALGGMNGSEKKLFDLESGQELAACPDKSPAHELMADRAFQTVFFDNSLWDLKSGQAFKIPTDYSVSDYPGLALSPDEKEFSALGTYQETPNPAALAAGTATATPPKTWNDKPDSFLQFSLVDGGVEFSAFSPRAYAYNDATRKWRPLEQYTQAKAADRKRQMEFSFVSNVSPSLAYGVSSRGEIIYPKSSNKANVPLVEGNLWLTSQRFLSDNLCALAARGMVKVYDFNTQKLVCELKVDGGENGPGIAGCAQWLAVIGGDWRSYEKRVITVYSIPDGTQKYQTSISPSGDVVFKADGSQMAICSGNKLTLVSTADWHVSSTTVIDFGRIFDATYSADGSRLLLRTDVRLYPIVDTATGKITHTLGVDGPSPFILDDQGNVISQP